MAFFSSTSHLFFSFSTSNGILQYFSSGPDMSFASTRRGANQYQTSRAEVDRRNQTWAALASLPSFPHSARSDCRRTLSDRSRTYVSPGHSIGDLVAECRCQYRRSHRR
eukprot:3293166-Rhodomonas_salina.3